MNTSQHRKLVRNGALVLIKEDCIIRNKWPLARFAEVFLSSDGVVWVVKLKTSTGTHRRPSTNNLLLRMRWGVVRRLKEVGNITNYPQEWHVIYDSVNGWCNTTRELTIPLGCDTSRQVSWIYTWNLGVQISILSWKNIAEGIDIWTFHNKSKM